MRWQNPPDKGTLGKPRSQKNYGGYPVEDQLAAVARAEEGESLSDLAREYKVSRERIRQWVEKHSKLSNDEIRRRRSENRANGARDRAVKMLRLMRDSGQIEATTDVPAFLRKYLRDAFTEDEVRELQIVSYGHRKGNRVTNEAILDDLRRVAQIVDGPLTGPKFDLHTRTVSQVRVLQIFGKWSTACEEAGVAYRPAIRDNYELKYTTEDCLEAVRQFLKYHRHGSFKLYCEWAQRNNKPSGGTLRNRLDRRWLEIRHMAMKEDAA
jgi:hypothetical protein